jgi:hypothetical protein
MGKPQQVLYFGYGSNLNVPVMLSRVPHAKLLFGAYLPYYKITFAGTHPGNGGGGKATLVPTMSLVPGALYSVTRDDLLQLDRVEGTPYANHRHNEYVYGWDGTRYEAFLYRQSSGTPYHRPSENYLRMVVGGRKMFGYPFSDVIQEALR